MKIKTHSALENERREWLDKFCPKWKILSSEEAIEGTLNCGIPVNYVKTTYYLDIDDDKATLYLLKWA